MILSHHQRDLIEARLNEYIRKAAEADKHGRHAEVERLNDRHDALFLAAAAIDNGTGDARDLRLVCDVLGLSLS